MFAKSQRSESKQTPQQKKERPSEPLIRQRSATWIKKQKEPHTVTRNLLHSYDPPDEKQNTYYKQEPVQVEAKPELVSPSALPSSYVLALKCVQDAIAVQTAQSKSQQQEIAQLKSKIAEDTQQKAKTAQREVDLKECLQKSIQQAEELRRQVLMLKQEAIDKEEVYRRSTDALFREIAEKESRQVGLQVSKQLPKMAVDGAQEWQWNLGGKIESSDQAEASRLRDWLRKEKELISLQFQLEKMEVQMQVSSPCVQTIKRYAQLRRNIQERQIALTSTKIGR